MKSQHFCIPEHIEQLKDPNVRTIISYRTLWIPQFRVGEIVDLKIKDENGDNKFYCNGIVLECSVVKYRDIDEAGRKELERYKRKFSPYHRFFKEVFEKVDDLTQLKFTRIEKIQKIFQGGFQ